MSEARHWAVVMPPSKTTPKAKAVMPMPLKSVAKGMVHRLTSRAAAWVRLGTPAAGLEKHACQGALQASYLAVEGRPALPHASRLTG